MAEVSEVVRVSVIIDGGEEAVQTVQLTDEAIQNLVSAFTEAQAAARQAGESISEPFDDLNQRLTEQLVDPLQRATATINDVRDAQRSLNSAFGAATNNDQRERVAQLRREYDGLEAEIIAAAEAQDVYSGQLRGFGGSTSAANQSLIELGRGIEDVRFGAANAINNIQPVISAFERLQSVARGTGVSVRDQLVSALTGPAGLLFAFQSILTIVAVVGPAIESLFSDAGEAASDFTSIAGEALGVLIDFEREADFVFQIDTNEEELEQNLNRVLLALEEARSQITELEQSVGGGRTGPIVSSGVGPAGAAVRALTQEEQDRLSVLERQRDILEELEEQLQVELETTRALALAEEQLRSTETGTPVDPDADTAEDEEREQNRIARLREQLNRSLASQEVDLLGETLQARLAAEEEVFRRRLNLAREARADEGTIQAIEQARIERLAQIEEEYIEEIAEKRRLEAEKQDRERQQATDRQARLEERLANEVSRARIEAIDDEEDAAIASAEDEFRRRIELARSVGDVQAVAELETLLQTVRLQIAEDFAERRADLEIREMERAARAAESIARELEREFEARIRDVQQFTDALVFSISSELGRSRSISNEEVALTRADFSAAERELRTSLDRRLIDQEEFDREIRRIAIDRANFEKEVEQDRASFFARAGQALVDELIQIGLQELSAFIAKETARLVFAQQAQAAATAATVASQAAIAAAAAPAAAAVSIATFGAASAAGTAAANTGILQIVGLIRSLSLGSLAGFEEGGFTGNRDRHEIAGVVHGGEYVFPEDLVRNNLRAFRKLHGMLSSGVDLSDVMHIMGVPGFQLGGFVPIDQVIQSPSTVPGGTQAPTVQADPALLTVLSRLDKTVSTLANGMPPVEIQPRESRGITRGAEIENRRKIARRFR